MRRLGLHNQSFPPKVDQSEVIASDPRNETYFEVWARKPKSQNGSAAETDGSNDAAAVRELASLLKTAMADRGKPEPDAVQNTLINWALTQTSKDREQNSPAALAGLITALKDVGKENRGVEKSEILAVIGAIRDMQPKQQDPLAVLQQAKNLFAPAGESERGTDEISRLDQILTFATKLANLRTGNAGGRNGWEIGLDYGKEIGIPVLQMIQNFMAMRTGGMMPPLAAPGAPAAAANAAFDPYRNPEMMRQFARSMNTQTATAPPASPAGTGPSVPPDPMPYPAAQASPANELAAFVQQYGGLVVNHLNMGTTGWGFADYVVGLLGTATHAQICAQGESALLQALLAVPEISMFGELRLKKWVHEFVNFEEFLDTEEEGEEAAAATGKS